MSGADQDAELLAGIRRDEPGAFERFVHRYGDRIFGIGMHVCGEREDARDVLQETLLQAYRSLKKLKEPRAMRSWLYRVASNACLMKRRKRSGEPDRQLSLDELMPRGRDEAADHHPSVHLFRRDDGHSVLVPAFRRKGHGEIIFAPAPHHLLLL